MWSRILIDHVFIHEQLGISKEGTIDATNVIFDEPCLEEDCRPTCLH
jgi:hypothetical protein